MLGFLFPAFRMDHYSAYGITRADVTNAAEMATMDVNKRIDSLELACAGLWQLLKTKAELSDEELMAAIRELDMRDGQLDGRIHSAVETCPHCHHKLLSRRSPKCSWCGRELNKGPF